MADPGTCVDCDPKAEQLTLATGSTAQEQSASEPVAKVEQPKIHNPLDPSTFVPPLHPVVPSVTVEFCDRCGWKHRATWTATELLVTFPPPVINAVTLVPHNTEETGGRFRVWLYLPGEGANGPNANLIWDRKVEGGFPELKVLKQRLRDHIDPGRSLGHSDKK